MAHITGTDRAQVLLLPDTVDDYVDPDNPVRFIDAFVDSLDLAGAGFERAEPKETGRPGYDPSDLLKLYIYGYLNRVRSSRRLEAETHRNLEAIRRRARNGWSGTCSRWMRWTRPTWPMRAPARGGGGIWHRRLRRCESARHVSKRTVRRCRRVVRRFWCRQPTGIGDNEIGRIAKRNGILYLPDVGSKTASFFSAFAGISASN